MWTSRLQPPIELRVQPKVGERLCLCGLHFAFCFGFVFTSCLLFIVVRRAQDLMGGWEQSRGPRDVRLRVSCFLENLCAGAHARVCVCV